MLHRTRFPIITVIRKARIKRNDINNIAIRSAASIKANATARCNPDTIRGGAVSLSAWAHRGELGSDCRLGRGVIAQQNNQPVILPPRRS
jgi:hypothetical protein